MSTFMEGCCEDDGTCDDPGDKSESWVDTCTSAFSDFDCDSTVAGTLPDACSE